MPRFITAMVLATVVATGSDPTQIRLVGTRFAHEVRAGGTLTAIGARHGVSVVALVALNHLADRNAIDAGATLVIDNRHLAIISGDRALSINIAQRMLYRIAGSEGDESHVGRPALDSRGDAAAWSSGRHADGSVT